MNSYKSGGVIGLREREPVLHNVCSSKCNNTKKVDEQLECCVRL